MRVAEEAAGENQTARMLVRRAAMSVEVDELGAGIGRTYAITTALAGYVDREDRAGRVANLMLRVPESKLDLALDSLSRLGKVTSRSVSSQDVTNEAIDVEARLRTLTATRDRLRELLARSSAVADVVAVERELARVQAELESLQGRLQHLRTEAALSELHLTLEQRIVLGPLGRLFSGIGHAIGKLFVIR